MLFLGIFFFGGGEEDIIILYGHLSVDYYSGQTKAKGPTQTTPSKTSCRGA